MGDELVECHSGFAYAERPVALRWQDERLEIDLIEAQWRTPQGKYFRVRTQDGQIFVLCYAEQSDEWWIQPAEKES